MHECWFKGQFSQGVFSFSWCKYDDFGPKQNSLSVVYELWTQKIQKKETQVIQFSKEHIAVLEIRYGQHFNWNFLAKVLIGQCFSEVMNRSLNIIYAHIRKRIYAAVFIASP